MEVINVKETKLYLHCTRCGSNFSVLGVNYKRAGGKETETNLDKETDEHFFPYCCPGCKKTYFTSNVKRLTGSEHPNWQGGIAENDRDRLKCNNWRQHVFTKYKGQCFLTGVRDSPETPLEAHHLESWSICEERRFDPSNGVLVTREIHKQFHSLYGGKTVTAQFEHFCQKYYNVNVFPWNSPNAEPLSADMQIENVAKQKFENIIAQRGYQIIEGNYKNKNSHFVLYCEKHKKA